MIHLNSFPGMRFLHRVMRGEPGDLPLYLLLALAAGIPTVALVT